MLRLVARRLIVGVIVLFVVSLLVFAASLLLPGDAAQAILGRTATPERLAALREQLHLDQPAYQRYLTWLGDLFSGSLGKSLANGQPVGELIAERTANSVVLLFWSALIATPLSIAAGTWSALRRGRAVDNVLSTGSLVMASLPEFVVGILLIVLFSTTVLNWFPAVALLDDGRSIFSQGSVLVLPVATLVLAVSPYITRMMRATMLEVLDSEFVQQARLKGVPERTVLLRHALPNAIGPVAQVIALQLAWLAGGVVVVEYLFRFPGIGQGLVDSVTNRDLPVLQALVMLIAFVYVLFNLIADIVGILSNPKLRTAK
ncbi:MAG: ABC transporter permease subunit [Streptosporangiales bacterium]|nr:ABC transporter permease subunit [Streptosporangiales bacterium]